jgi:hypothetical protein
LPRLLLYRREAAAGLLELLRGPCNKKAGAPPPESYGGDDF